MKSAVTLLFFFPLLFWAGCENRSPNHKEPVVFSEPPIENIPQDASEPPRETTQESPFAPEQSLRWEGFVRLLDSSSKTPPETKPNMLNRSVSFRKDIVPIIDQALCGNVHCHGTGIGGFFTSFDLNEFYKNLVNKTSAQDKEWTLIVPRKPNKSLFYLKVLQKAPPVGGKMGNLNKKSLLLLYTWIMLGAQNN